MSMEDRNEILEVNSIVILAFLGVDIINMISLFPDHIGMMLYKERVTEQFSAEILLLLHFCRCVFC